jgi:hypothetical protein
MTESEDKGYTVKDRRHHQVSGEDKAAAAPPEAEAPPAAPEEQAGGEPAFAADDFPVAEIDFSSFIFSLSSSALLALGEIPDPVTGEKQKHPALAKQTIDLLGLLREKTRGNLTVKEEELFDSILYDLRLRYVREVS